MWANIFGIRNLCQIAITIKKTCPTKYITFGGIFYFMNKIPRNAPTNVKSFRNKTIIQAVAFGIDFICCVFTFGSNRICELSYTIYVPFENIKTCRIYIFGVVIFHHNSKKNLIFQTSLSVLFPFDPKFLGISFSRRHFLFSIGNSLNNFVDVCPNGDNSIVYSKPGFKDTDFISKS